MDKLSKQYIEFELPLLKNVQNYLKCAEEFYQGGDATLEYPKETLEAIRPLIENSIEDLTEVIGALEKQFCLDGTEDLDWIKELEERKHKIMLLKDAARVFWNGFENQLKGAIMLDPIIEKAKKDVVKEALNTLGWNPTEEEQELVDSEFGL